MHYSDTAQVQGTIGKTRGVLYLIAGVHIDGSAVRTAPACDIMCLHVVRQSLPLHVCRQRAQVRLICSLYACCDAG